MRIDEVFDKTADLIEERGLNKRTYVDYQDGNIKYCTLGALFFVMYGTPVPSSPKIRSYTTEHCSILAKSLPNKKNYYDNFSIITQWNDRPGINKSHVVSKLRALAKKYREEHNITN